MVSDNSSTEKIHVSRGGKAFKSRAEFFSELYRENYDAVYNYVSYIMAGSSAAEDVTAEAFLKAARSFVGFDEARAKFTTWVVAIARNCIIDYWKKERKSITIDDVPESKFAVLDKYNEIERNNEELKRLLISLNDEERQIIYLKYYEGCKNIEIAKRLGMNPSTVATKLQRAISKMSKLMEE